MTPQGHQNIRRMSYTLQFRPISDIKRERIKAIVSKWFTAGCGADTNVSNEGKACFEIFGETEHRVPAQIVTDGYVTEQAALQVCFFNDL